MFHFSRFVLVALVISIAGSACSRTANAQRSMTLKEAREALLRQVAAQGVTNPRVLEAVRETPRHLFVPSSQRKYAWYDMALPIGSGQTISPPFVVANMTQHLDPQPDDKVLEIGTGSGYQAAILSPLVKEVYSIEIVEPLGKRAASVLKRLKYENVTTRVGDGYLGWAEHAPFDKIIVTCSPEKVPQPLIDQLRDGGRMVIPIGERFQQTLYLFQKVDGKLEQQAIEPTFFVPMTGKAEELRVVKQDDGLPDLHNGGFEERGDDQKIPAGWYYVREGKMETDPTAPQGEQRITFENTVPNKSAQALQALEVDGRKVKEIEVSLWVRGVNVRAPESVRVSYHASISFFDENRSPVGERNVGLWTGTYDWVKQTTRIEVPERARLSVFALGLCGSTGEISFDGVEITVVHEGIEPSSSTP